MEMIKIKVVSDEEFERNFWRFEPEEVVKKASDICIKNFGVGLRISEKTNWQSPFVRSPGEIIPYLRGKTREEMLGDLKNTISYINEKDLKKLEEGLEKTKHPSAYLEGYLGASLFRILLDSLRIQIGKQEILWALSGRVVILRVFSKTGIYSDILGQAYSKRGIMIANLCSEPLYVFLHELGHLFGAVHKERTVMEEKLTARYLNFDRRNRRVISKNFKKFFETKSPD